eukprot:scaffold27790_cov70-Phaeocystis_antarctica.AAC.2
MTIERPTAHILPRGVLGSYRIESVVSLQVAHLAVGLVGARRIARLERGVVVARGHRRAAAVAGAACRVSGEAVNVPLVASCCALQRAKAARDCHRAGYRCLVEAHRARRRAAHRREAHLEPVRDGCASPARASRGLIDDDRAAEHAVRAVKRQRRVDKVTVLSAREPPVLVAACRVGGARARVRHWEVVHVPLVGEEGGADTRHCSERHRCRHIRTSLEELDRASSLTAEHNVHAHARLTDVGAGPARAVNLVDHDRTADDPLAASAALGRIVQGRGLGIAVRAHVGALANAQPAELARKVTQLAVRLVGARRGVARLEGWVVVAASHRHAAAHVVHSGIPKGWELMDCRTDWQSS